MTATDLATFVGSSTTDLYVVTCWDTAVVLVDRFIGDAVVPDAIKDRCYLACGSELYHARNAPNGISQFTELAGAPVRIARDPMTPVYSLLSPWVVFNL